MATTTFSMAPGEIAVSCFGPAASMGHRIEILQCSARGCPHSGHTHWASCFHVCCMTFLRANWPPDINPLDLTDVYTLGNSMVACTAHIFHNHFADLFRTMICHDDVRALQYPDALANTLPQGVRDTMARMAELPLDLKQAIVDCLGASPRILPLTIKSRLDDFVVARQLRLAMHSTDQALRLQDGCVLYVGIAWIGCSRYVSYLSSRSLSECETRVELRSIASLVVCSDQIGVQDVHFKTKENTRTSFFGEYRKYLHCTIPQPMPENAALTVLPKYRVRPLNTCRAIVHG